MKFTKHITASLALLLALTNASCSKTSSRWNYTNEDIEQALYIEDGVLSSEEEQLVFTASVSYPFIKDSVSVNDVVLFDVDKVIEARDKYKEENDGKLFTWSQLSEYSLPINNVLTNENGRELSVYFNTESYSQFGIMVHKDATYLDRYVFATQEFDNTQFSSDYLEKYQESKLEDDAIMSGSKAGMLLLNLVESCGKIAVSYASANPAGIFDGVISVVDLFWNSFFPSSEPTIADILNKIAELNTRLDNLNAQIQKTQNKLLEQGAEIKAGVDKLILEEQEVAIAQFRNTVIEPLNSYSNNMSAALNTALSHVAFSAGKSFDLVIYKNEKGVYDIKMDYLPDVENPITYNITMSKFINARNDYNSKGYVSASFVDAFCKDIDEATKDVILPSDSNISRERFVSMAYTALLSKLMDEYYSDSAHSTELNQIYNLTSNLISAINTSSSKSIVDFYYERATRLYNFNNEVKPVMRSIYANLIDRLDSTFVAASQACFYAKRDTTELEDAFKLARTRIVNKYNQIKQIPDTFCYPLSKELTAGVFNVTLDEHYGSLKNPRVVFYKAMNRKQSQVVSLNLYDIVSGPEYMYLGTRFSMLKKAKAINSSNFINYLISRNIIDEYQLSIYEQWQERYTKSPGHEKARILCGLENWRQMNDSDKGRKLILADRREGNWFDVGSEYTFRGSHSSSAWNGQLLEGQFIDIETGTSVSYEPLVYYAYYEETKWYWKKDEHNYFISYKYDETKENGMNFFFAIYTKNDRG